jgi:hypothetical protein
MIFNVAQPLRQRRASENSAVASFQTFFKAA